MHNVRTIVIGPLHSIQSIPDHHTDLIQRYIMANPLGLRVPTFQLCHSKWSSHHQTWSLSHVRPFLSPRLLSKLTYIWSLRNECYMFLGGTHLKLKTWIMSHLFTSDWILRMLVSTPEATRSCRCKHWKGCHAAQAQLSWKLTLFCRNRREFNEIQARYGIVGK